MDLLTTSEVAKRLNVDRQSVFRYVWRGLLMPQEIRKTAGSCSRVRYLFSDAAVEAFQCKHTTHRKDLTVPYKPLDEPGIRLYDLRFDAIKKAIFERDSYTCQYCKCQVSDLECDHIIPISKGGTNEPENLITSCGRCNASKGDRHPSEWLDPDRNTSRTVQSRWREISSPVIASIHAAFDGDLVDATVALRNACPFAIHSYPYQIWRSEVRRQFGLPHKKQGRSVSHLKSISKSFIEAERI